MQDDKALFGVANNCFTDGIAKFSGDDKTHSSSKWVQDIEDNAEVFSWTPQQKLIIARRSLTGTAELWLRTEKCYKTFEELKVALQKEFPEQLNVKEMHELMSARKKRREETYYQYMLVMKELGKRAKFPDYVAIQYIVDGIQDLEMNKAILYGVTTYAALKEKLAIYENIKNKSRIRASFSKQYQEGTSGGGHAQKTQAAELKKNCYKCGDSSHLSNSCPNGVKCFKCDKFGHIAPDCKSSSTQPQNRQRHQSMCVKFAANDGMDQTQDGENRIEVSNVNIEGDGDSDSGSQLQLMLNVNNENQNKLQKSVKMIEICGQKVETLIDSGSDLNLITADLFFELKMLSYSSEKLLLTGLGSSKVNTLGKFNVIINMDGHNLDVLFYVIPVAAMPYKILLGQPFLMSTTVLFLNGRATLISKGEGEMLRCLLSDAQEEQLVSYIPDDNIRTVVTQMVEDYKPMQVEEAPIEMKIILKDDIPVAQRPRRLSLHEQHIVDQQIKEWMQKGIIRPSYSEYSSPLVLVKKKDGSTRVCVDYRKINAKMVKDEFPLPIIDDHMDRLSGCKIFSKLDLKDAFFHLKVWESSKKYTSFVTQTGQYEFNRAPFGLSICPNYFTRFITIIFRDIIAKGYLLIFIDDIMLMAETYKEALDRLRQVLKVAAIHGLQINWKKSNLLTTRVEYLGHIIENGTVKPSSEKVEAVMKFPEPRTIKHLQSFIGLTSYFRKFIEGYSWIARPLTDLLKKTSIYHFGEEQRIAFNQLKKKLTQGPVLKIFNPSLKTELHTDASQQAYAAVLMQQDPNDNCLHPVYYMSKKTTDAEKKYTSYELEALAVIEGVKKFRKYLCGISFKIVTDCSAFEMTLKKKDLTTRVARWVLLLQDYDYTVEHRSGSKMRHVDALSRSAYVNIVTRGIHDQLRKAQQCDEGTNAILEIVKQKPYMDYYEHNGLLYKGEEGKIVVPKGMEMQIIKKAHENGHFGKKKMIELIEKDYYIKDFTRKIEEVIVSCIPCLLALKKEGKQEGFLNSIEKESIPLSTLHCDHIGPLSETKKQYNYILTIVDAFTKFVWLFPTKTTNSAELINKLRIHQQAFGNPSRMITDKGAAFTSNDFSEYCQAEGIKHVTVTTGVPRGNGQVERVHRVLISIFAKLCLGDEKQWYRHVSQVQRSLNSTFQRSIGTTPFELLIGTKMKLKENMEIINMLQEEEREEYVQEREKLREHAKIQILKIQEENRKNFNKKRKESVKYAVGDFVAIRRTQFGKTLKIKAKYLGPYKVVKVLGKDRYEVEKAEVTAEGPIRTSTAADYMKRWPGTCSIAMLLMSTALAAIGLQRAGWLDRVVQYQKEKFINEVRELAPINIKAEIRPKPVGYEDSTHWDYDSVVRLLTLIRGSETAKPVHKALRRMLQPTRRLMMSMKESMHRFPSIKNNDNAFYYDVDYSSEEGNLPAPPPVPEDQVVLVVSNPVEARLPSARISVKLLREILEARARAARQMPSTTHIIPWVEFIKNRNYSTQATTDAVSEAGVTTDGNAMGDASATTVADDADGTTVADDADGTTVTDAGGDGDKTTTTERVGDQTNTDNGGVTAEATTESENEA